MSVAEFYYLEGGLFFGFLVAAGLTVISLNRPAYGVAQRFAWAAALMFGSIAVVWGVTTNELVWIRIPAVGIAGLVAAISLTEAVRFIKNREFPAAVHVETLHKAEQERPLQFSPATIDLDDSQVKFSRNAVVGDLGTVVRGRNKASAIVEGNVFARADAIVDLPAPTGAFSSLSDAGLRAKCMEMIHVLESQSKLNDAQWPEIRSEALSLSSELGWRAKESIAVPTDGASFSLRHGRNVLVFGNQVGVDAPEAAALYMKFLLSKLGR